mmetsp:Transcript_7341/g.17252  ORF Transcript_7341/g.17252 Transcript_7341/m.17252 type:complete len:523 (+) Transcript_7341:1041-2609(+)
MTHRCDGWSGDTLGEFLLEESMPVPVGGQSVLLTVPDGTLSVILFQENHVYGSAYTGPLLAQAIPADPSSVPDPPRFAGYEYGSFMESLAWTAGVLTQYSQTMEDLPGGQTSNFSLTVSNPLANGLSYGVAGAILYEDDQGQLAQSITVQQCVISPEKIAQYLNSTRCASGAIDGKCYDVAALQTQWQCPAFYAVDIRRHTRPGEPVPGVKPLGRPQRPVTPSNQLVGAVVISQTRSAPAPCALAHDCTGRCEGARAQIVGQVGAGRECLGGDSRQPFGVDPFFLQTSPLYNGLPPNLWYAEQEFGDSGLPWGFFPLDPARVKDSRYFSEHHFNAYLDARMDLRQAERAVDFLEQGFFYDNYTSTLEVQLLTFNAELDAIAALGILFKVTKGGEVTLVASLLSLSLMEFLHTESDMIIAILVTLVAVFLLSAQLPALIQARKQGSLWREVMSFRIVMDWAGYVSIPGSLWYFLYFASRIHHSFSFTQFDSEAALRYPLSDIGATGRIFDPDPEGEVATLAMI